MASCNHSSTCMDHFLLEHVYYLTPVELVDSELRVELSTLPDISTLRGPSAMSAYVGCISAVFNTVFYPRAGHQRTQVR